MSKTIANLSEIYLQRIKTSMTMPAPTVGLAEARADIFDYIERFHNPRRRSKLEVKKLKNLLFTKPSVETG